MKKIFYTLVLILTTSLANAVTTYINGAVGNGNFEAGAANWTIANDVTNKWFIGANYKCSGAQGAYVGTAVGNNNYTNTVLQVSHLYKTAAIAFTAGETQISLSFNYRCVGEACCDYLQVFLTSAIPVAGTVCAPADQVGASVYNQQAACTPVTINIPGSYAGTTKYLVFQWRNDGSLGTNPAVTLDDVVLTSAVCPLSGLPYTESFESITTANTLPTCMGATNLGSLVYTYLAPTGSYNQAARTGTRYASFRYGGNDWIFTQGMTLTGGVTYDFSFWYVTDGFGGWTTLDAYFGNAQNAGAMNPIAGTTVSGPTNTTYAQDAGAFTPAVTGTYYMGIHCASTAAPEYLTIDDINVAQSVPMVYVSSTTTQTNTSAVVQNSVSQQIIGVQIVTSGSQAPLSATSFTLSTAGCTSAVNDIQNAKLWYTGLSGTFATTTQIGGIVANPNGGFTITPNQALLNGINYFWLTYDIKLTATIGDVVDAACNSLTVAGLAHVPTVTAPAGNRPITDCPCGTGYKNAGTLAAVYNDAGQTTCGQVNDITSANVTNICGSSSYYGGEDVVYYFTPTVTGQITITVTSAGTYMGIMLYALCPLTGGSCIGSAQSAAGNQTLVACVTAGVKYYLVIDSWPAPTCNPYSLSISTVTPCGGVMAAGTAIATPATITCPNQAVVLSDPTATAGCVSYQWYGKPTGAPTYVVIPGAITVPYTVYPNTSYNYILVVSCPASGSTVQTPAITVNVTGASPVNDEPCNATPLTVNSGSISYITGDNNCASATELVSYPGLTAPGCGWYLGGDVWFTFTVPASGRVIVDMNTSGGPTDMDMAWYTGNCSALTLLECDDFDSQNGSMPMICRTGMVCSVPGDCQQNGTLTPGSQVWVRVWNYGNSSFGTFLIGAYDPGGAGAPSTCASATVIPSVPYSATGLTTCCKANDYTAADACLSAYMGGEDYVFKYTPAATQTLDITLSGTNSFTGVFVTDKCPNVGGANCVAQNTSATGNPKICGVTLTAGTTYYIIVDTDPLPNCTNFNIYMAVSQTSTCNLNYTESAIAFSNDPYTGTTITLPIDDRYSPSYVPIGFPFCFDGIQYTQLLVSSNAYVIFDPVSCATNEPSSNAAPGSYSAWSITAAMPNTTNAPRNCIMFPWQDTNPAVGGALTYNTLGAFPNRRFIVSFNGVNMFSSSCSAYQFTGQLKLFETTNNIEMHIARKDMCAAWNGGVGILGLHNYNGTIAKIRAGSNYPLQWSNTNVALRYACNCNGTACIVPLPVEMLNFDGKNESSRNKLWWSTASETNNDYFIVEKFVDMKYVEIGKVNGAGNSNEINNYEFYDDNVTDNVSYYRLKQVDYNGESNYSDIISVRKSVAFVQSVYPNPATDMIMISLGQDVTTVNAEIYNAMGQLVLSKKIEANTSLLQIEIPEMMNGIYTIKVNDIAGNLILSDKVVVNRK